jgi:carbamoyl-phosphate synthase large subunit
MDKEHAPEIAKGLHKAGFKLLATKGTQKIIEAAGIPCELVLKISEGRPNIQDAMKNGDITMAINTSDNNTSKKDATVIRQIVLSMNIPYFTTLSAARSAIDALEQMEDPKWNEPQALQDYLNN